MADQPIPNQALADAIDASGLRKGYVADRVGVGNWTLSRWLKGLTPVPPEKRAMLAGLLGGLPDDFVSPERVSDSSQPVERAA